MTRGWVRLFLALVVGGWGFVVHGTTEETARTNPAPTPGDVWECIPCKGCSKVGSSGGDPASVDVEPDYTGVSSLVVKMSLGCASRPGQYRPDQLFIRYEQPDASLFSPAGLSYAPCAKVVAVSATTNASGGPAKLTLLHPSKVLVDVAFAANSSVGVPQGEFYNWKLRVQMVDSNGQAVVKTPVFFDVVYADGHRERLSAAPATLGQLVGGYTPQGGLATLAASGLDLVTSSNGVVLATARWD